MILTSQRWGVVITTSTKLMVHTAGLFEMGRCWSSSVFNSTGQSDVLEVTTVAFDSSFFVLQVTLTYSFRRITSRSCLQLGRSSESLKWAEKAFATEPSKQSLFTVFQVTLEAKPEATEEELVHFIQQLKTRDDFEIEDLLAMGKLASNFGSSRQDLVMHILDELCHILLQSNGYPAKISVAVVLQNAAQLAYSKLTGQHETSDISEDSYGEKFLSYAGALLQASTPNFIDQKGNVGPSSVFEWFFRMR